MIRSTKIFFSIIFFFFLSCTEDSINPEMKTSEESNSTNHVTLDYDLVFSELTKNINNGRINDYLSLDSTVISSKGLRLNAESPQAVNSFICDTVYVFDMLNEESSNLPSLKMKFDSYSKVEVSLSVNAVQQYPSIYAKGKYTSLNNDTIPFSFSYNGNFTIEAQSSSKSITEKTLMEIIIDPNKWFSVLKKEKLELATINENGVMEIDSNNNVGLYLDLIKHFQQYSDYEITIVKQ